MRSCWQRTRRPPGSWERCCKKKVKNRFQVIAAAACLLLAPDERVQRAFASMSLSLSPSSRFRPRLIHHLKEKDPTLVDIFSGLHVCITVHPFLYQVHCKIQGGTDCVKLHINVLLFVVSITYLTKGSKGSVATLEVVNVLAMSINKYYLSYYLSSSSDLRR